MRHILHPQLGRADSTSLLQNNNLKLQAYYTSAAFWWASHHQQSLHRGGAFSNLPRCFHSSQSDKPARAHHNHTASSPPKELRRKSEVFSLQKLAAVRAAMTKGVGAVSDLQDVLYSQLGRSNIVNVWVSAFQQLHRVGYESCTTRRRTILISGFAGRTRCSPRERACAPLDPFIAPPRQVPHAKTGTMFDSCMCFL